MDYDYSRIFSKYKRFIITVTILSTAASVAAAFTLQPYYVAVAKVYSSSEDFIKLIYSAMNSDDVIDGVIDRMGLVKVFNASNKDEARNIFISHLQTIFDARFNTVEIHFAWKDPGEAAAIANALPEELQRTYPSTALSYSMELHQQYTIRLNGALDDLKSIQARGVPGLSEADRAKLNALAVEIGTIRSNVGMDEILLKENASSTPLSSFLARDIVSNQNKLLALRGEMQNIEGPSPDSDTVLYARDLEGAYINKDFYGRLLDKMRTEDRELNMQVLEKAGAPDKTVSPDKILIIAVTALLSFLASVIFVLVADSISNPELKRLLSDRE